MRELPQQFGDAIEAMEAAAGHLGKITAIAEWPNLSPGQRVVALSIACLEHIHERPVTSTPLSKLTGMDASRLEKIFDEHEHPPYRWSEIPARGWAFLASQALQYGEE